LDRPVQKAQAFKLRAMRPTGGSIHLRQQLARTTDEAKRRQTSTLLAEEEIKDHLPLKEK